MLAIHQRLIERFGGSPGVRDPGLLESALYRPRTGYHADLAGMAAALFESLLINHSFVDGNKRVAFFATDVFLRLNGWSLEVEPDEAHGLLAGCSKGTRPTTITCCPGFGNQRSDSPEPTIPQVASRSTLGCGRNEIGPADPALSPAGEVCASVAGQTHLECAP